MWLQMMSFNFGHFRHRSPVVGQNQPCLQSTVPDVRKSRTATDGWDLCPAEGSSSGHPDQSPSRCQGEFQKVPSLCKELLGSPSPSRETECLRRGRSDEQRPRASSWHNGPISCQARQRLPVHRRHGRTSLEANLGSHHAASSRRRPIAATAKSPEESW